MYRCRDVLPVPMEGDHDLGGCSAGVYPHDWDVVRYAVGGLEVCFLVLGFRFAEAGDEELIAVRVFTSLRLLSFLLLPDPLLSRRPLILLEDPTLVIHTRQLVEPQLVNRLGGVVDVGVLVDGLGIRAFPKWFLL